MAKKRKPIYTGTAWDQRTIEKLHDACAQIAFDELGLDTYPNQFEIITSEQMLDAYTSIGMPVSYQHWSYGKHFLQHETEYRRTGGLAYELVINSNPCVNYLMEENTATLQATVIAHAGFGHNHFFKNNYLFKEWTDASAIIDYLNFAKKFIADCEVRYGYEEVEKILDSAHALKHQGIDRYRKPSKLSAEKERERHEENELFLEKNFDLILDTTIPKVKKEEKVDILPHPLNPDENILKFIEKNSPSLKNWQREIIRIVRMISQYFYPQMQTQVMNEGFAVYTHMYIMNRLYDKGLINEGSMLELIHVNSSVLSQPGFEQVGAYFNPYKLGYSIFKDLERICVNPNTEDKEWYPSFAGSGQQAYFELMKDAVANYRDESFIQQYLTPTVMRDYRMFHLTDASAEQYQVSSIHNERGYKNIRNALSKQYDINLRLPDIQVVKSNLGSTRQLELVFKGLNGKLLDEDAAGSTLIHVRNLWGFGVVLKSVDDQGSIIQEYTVE